MASVAQVKESTNLVAKLLVFSPPLRRTNIALTLSSLIDYRPADLGVHHSSTCIRARKLGVPIKFQVRCLQVDVQLLVPL